MTTATLGWFVALIFFVAFITLWFSVSYRELSKKRRSLDAISEQVAVHRRLCLQERGGRYEISAQNMLSNKLIVYGEATREYNALLKKPMHRIPAFILGFRPVKRGVKQ